MKEDEECFEKLSPELSLVKEELTEKTEKPLLSREKDSKLSADFQKEKIKRFQESLEQSELQCDIGDQTNVTASVVLLSVIALLCLIFYYFAPVYVTNEVKLEEQLKSVLKIKESEEKMGNAMSLMNFLKDELAEKNEQLLLAKEMGLKLSADLQVEKLEIKNLQEALKQAKLKHLSDISNQINVQMEFKKQLESLLKMKDKIERNCEVFSRELNLMEEELAEKKEQLLLAEEIELKLLAKLQAEKDQVKNLLKALGTKHQWYQINFTTIVLLLTDVALLCRYCYCSGFAYATKKMKVKEQPLLKIKEESERIVEILSSELYLVRKKLSEKTAQLLLAGEKASELLSEIEILTKACEEEEKSKAFWCIKYFERVLQWISSGFKRPGHDDENCCDGELSVSSDELCFGDGSMNFSDDGMNFSDDSMNFSDMNFSDDDMNFSDDGISY